MIEVVRGLIVGQALWCVVGLLTCFTIANADAPTEKVTKEESEQAKVIGKLADKIDALEKSTNDKLNALSSSTDSSLKELEKSYSTLHQATNSRFNENESRLDDLERIVSGKDGKGGLQHQVTILHSKKADKKDK